MRKDDMRKELSIVIPTRNEEKNIANCVNGIVKELNSIKNLAYEIVIVNNNSTDRTQEKINQLKKKYPSIVRGVFEKKQSFGNSAKAGIAAVRGEYFCLVMADHSENPKDITKMVRLIKKNKYDAIHTNRFRKKDLAKDYPKAKFFFNRLGNTALALLYLVKFTDLSNAFRLIRTDIIRGCKLRSSGFELTLELSLLTIIRGKKFAEVDVHWYNRLEGEAYWKLGKTLVRYLKPLLYYLPYRYGILKLKIEE
ncbi:MAG: glycosyltransferase family 2 protein [Candidatus Woesearchaeota archaeon]